MLLEIFELLVSRLLEVLLIPWDVFESYSYQERCICNCLYIKSIEGEIKGSLKSFPFKVLIWYESKVHDPGKKLVFIMNNNHRALLIQLVFIFKKKN